MRFIMKKQTKGFWRYKVEVRLLAVHVNHNYAAKRSSLAQKRSRPKASSEHREAKLFGLRVKKAIRDTRAKGNPVAKYDLVRKAVYLEYPDGRKEYVDAK